MPNHSGNMPTRLSRRAPKARRVRIDLSPERIFAVVPDTDEEWSAPASIAVTLNEKLEMLVMAVGEHRDDAEIEHEKAAFDPKGEEIRRVLPFPAAWPKSASPLVFIEDRPPVQIGTSSIELGPKDVMLCWVLGPATINIALVHAMVRWAVASVVKDSSIWPLSWRMRIDIHWPDFDRLPVRSRDEFVRLLWDTYGRRILINERPATATRRTLRDLPPAAWKRLVVSGGVAVFGLGLLLWRGSAQQAGFFAAILVVWAACSWVSWVRT